MNISRKSKTVLISIAVVVAGAGLAAWLALPALERWAVGYHQRAVTCELEEWEREYSTVTDEASAIAAAEMVDYMRHYYVPGPGYRGPVEVEEALETQRRDSITRIVEALERHTGLDYGTNAQRWAEWAKERRADVNAETGSKINSATNTLQSVEANTNRTSVIGP